MDTKLFAAFWLDVMNEIPGKKAFQKLVYFGQILGLPFKQPYRMHYFGPYSESVAEEFVRAEDLGIIQYKSSSYKILPGKILDKYIDDNFEELQSNFDNLEKLVNYFGDMRPRELELYSTVHYIDNNQKLLYNEYDKDEIIAKVKDVKGEKFRLDEIAEAYHQLEEWDLLYRINPN